VSEIDCGRRAIVEKRRQRTSESETRDSPTRDWSSPSNWASFVLIGPNQPGAELTSYLPKITRSGVLPMQRPQFAAFVSLVVLTSAGELRAAETAGQRWAILIGVDDYVQAKDLQFAGADQQALRDRLVASGFPQRQVYLLHNKAESSRFAPFKSNIERELDLMLRLVEPNDLIVVAFSGHGVQLGDTAYLCPADANLDDPKTLISLDWFYDRLKGSPAAFKLLMVDACRNDPRPEGQRSLADESQRFSRSLDKPPPEGTMLLTSCSPGEISYEEKTLGHGVFMHYLLDGLRGQADENRDSQVSVGELAKYASRQTRVFVADRFADSQRPKLTSFNLALEALDYPLGDVGPRVPPVIVNSIGMKLALIPPGEFLMGSAESAETLAQVFNSKAEYFTDEHPQHRVRITQPFYFGVHEVTLGQFLKFYHDAKYKMESERDGKGAWGYTGSGFEQRKSFVAWSWGFEGYTKEHPVVNVTWNDAVAFCEWLSQKEGVTYRLPTEAEWEYACRAGTQTRFFGGDAAESLLGYANVADQSNKRIPGIGQDFPYATFDDRFAFTAAVGSFKPNAFGLHDMHGNVLEWCQDWYDKDYYAGSPVNDPQGPPSGAARVLRGGSWDSYPGFCRSADRIRGGPAFRSDYTGFRVARTP
jgi:formylglycine-generating enzyme required for sulfatase activity